MPVIFRSQVSRFFLPLCLVLVAVACCALYTHTLEAVQTEPQPDEAFTTSSVISQHKEYEEWMQQKAERVLRAFGEETPMAVVSVEVDMSLSETEFSTPDPTVTAVESRQRTEENFSRDLTGQPVDEAAKPKYLNVKQAENFLVAETKVKTVRKTPKLAKITCVVFVSESNKERCQDIESTVAVALGLVPGRGDTVRATVR